MRLQNNIVEYIQLKNIEELKEGIVELAEKELIQKAICVGHFIMWSFSQTEKEVTIVNQLIVTLKEMNVLTISDIEDG